MFLNPNSTSNQIAIGLLKTIAIILFVLGFMWFVGKVSTVIVYFFISLFLALVSLPFIHFMERKLKFKRLLATIVVLIFQISFFVGFVLLFVPLLLSQSKSLSLLNTFAIEQKIQFILRDFTDWASARNLNIEKITEQANFIEKLDYTLIPNLINYIFSGLGGFIIGALSVMFITFFMIKDQNGINETFIRVLPDNQRTPILNSIQKVYYLLSRYLIGIIIQVFIIFSLDFLVLFIFGVDNALIIAFLCGLLNIIPYVGPLMGTAMAAVLTMISKIGADFQTEVLPTTIYVVIGYMIVQLIDNFVNQPLIFSKSVKSHPLEIFTVILMAGLMFGILGMILAIPTYTVIKVFAKEFIPNNNLVRELTKKI